MDIQQALKNVVARQDLDGASMEAVMRVIMTGNATSAQIGGFLVALRMKGETPEEIAAAARVMRELATKVTVQGPYLVDTCGTGGDASGTFNVSTASAFVAAAAGCKVAKHGNRSVSSKSGSADLLEAAEVNLNLTPEQVARCIDTVGVGFLFAPQHHAAMKHAIGPRREMGVRTVFNLLGPLTNPAGAPNQVLGVFDRAWLAPMADVLRRLGSRHVMVVHAEDGLDEISIAAPTFVTELCDGVTRSYTISPSDFGVPLASLDAVRVAGADQSLAMIRDAFASGEGAAANLIALNAGAAIYCAGKAHSHAEGVKHALALMASGQARTKLDQFVQFTQTMHA
jgi:anthranilate phosphoribosyltransferase